MTASRIGQALRLTAALLALCAALMRGGIEPDLAQLLASPFSDPKRLTLI